MRRIVMFDQVSADGYFARPDGSLDGVVSDDDLQRGAVERMKGIDTILLGRRTYELFATFWPHALDDSPTAPTLTIAADELPRCARWRSS
jgi:dihydrofolate reductase